MRLATIHSKRSANRRAGAILLRGLVVIAAVAVGWVWWQSSEPATTSNARVVRSPGRLVESNGTFIVPVPERDGRPAEPMVLVPVPVPPDYDRVLTFDNGVRENQTMEALAKLKPVFDRKYGTVTPGNASQITDGGAAVVVASEDFVVRHGLKPIGRVESWGFAGLEPERMGLGPARSTPIALKKAGLSMKDIGLVEMNEAFAAQVLANLKEFAASKELGEISMDILNVNGGAIALGHPVGCSGTRLILTLLLEMRRREVRHGLATLCVGGGQGASVILEAV